MVIFPNAKVNIGLNIIEKRPDNFHNIETVLYPIGLADILEIVENTDGSASKLKITGVKIPGKPGENLCMRAYHLIAKDYPVPPVKIHLHKIIPMGAGLGGGSSDASFFIELISKKFSLRIPMNKKLEYAQKLGSDCSFFLKNKPVFAQGRGEKMKDILLSLKGNHLVIICPPIHVSTKEAYAGAVPGKSTEPLYNLTQLPISEWKSYISNQFEETVFEKFPVIAGIKKQLYSMGALYASMSGSGSSVYGIFESPRDITKIKKKFNGCFIWTEQLGY